MVSKEIRIFNVQKNRKGIVNHAIICDGKAHYKIDGLGPKNAHYSDESLCDGKDCQADSSETVDTDLLTYKMQDRFGVRTHVPMGFILVASYAHTDYYSFLKIYHGGEEVIPKELEAGTLLADGEGIDFRDRNSLYSSSRAVFYVRNENGKVVRTKVGKIGRKRTEKKLTQLRRGERKSEETYDVNHLKSRLTELMQLHRTSVVNEQIENVKEMLRLATSLSVEASIEAAEGSEAIAQELANARAKEIGAELELTRERLMGEKRAREEAREELSQTDEN